jgi:hypothetical protein
VKQLLLLFLLICQAGNAQLKISGYTCDKTGKKGLGFVSIGVVGTTIGTLSDQNGKFELTVPYSMSADSLLFFAIGYKPLRFKCQELAAIKRDSILLEALPLELEEVLVLSSKLKHKILGTTNYSKNNCTGFASMDGNWKGSESAILVRNKRTVLLEEFSFFVVHNTYEDSLPFRLTFYSLPQKAPDQKAEIGNWVGPTFLKKPIIFKLSIRHGQFTLPLRDYGIYTSGDFFISLECLTDEMDIARFCYTSSPQVPGYFKVKLFSSWRKTQDQGPDFNVKVSY